MKVEKNIIKRCDLDIKGITLLSEEEYAEYVKNIRRLDNTIELRERSWWLRSPYKEGGVVYMDGDSFQRYSMFATENYAVRPALILNNLNSSEFKIGDRFRLFSFNWTIIAKNYALCDSCIGKSPFRKDNEAKDAYDYQASDVKKFVEKWWNERTKPVCLTCQTELPQDAQFCFKCGTKVHTQRVDKVKVGLFTTKSCELDIEGITLLSKEEYVANRERIRKAEDSEWWLRSPGRRDEYGTYAPLVIDYLVPDDYPVEERMGARPVLILNHLNASDFKIGNSFRLFDFNWTIISKDYALCDSSIGRSPFRKDCEARDAYDYQASDVKILIEKWWNERTKPVCPNCQTELPQGAQFCFQCGTKVE